MSNLNLSLAAGYSVDSPALSKHVTLQAFSLSALARRMAAAFAAAEQRRIDATVARLIAANGGTLSDEVERQIARRLGA